MTTRWIVAAVALFVLFGVIETRGQIPILPIANQNADLVVNLNPAEREYKKNILGISDGPIIGTKYKLSVKNLGGAPAHNVRIALTALGQDFANKKPALGQYGDVYLVGNGRSSSCAKMSILDKMYLSATCTLEKLAVNESVDMWLRLAETQEFPYLYGQVMSASSDPDPDNNWDRGAMWNFAGQAPKEIADLAVSQSGMTDRGNQTQTYQVSVTNQGNTVANLVTFTQMFSQALPGTSIAGLESNGPSTICSSKEVQAGLAVVSCTVQQLEVSATAGVTIVYRNPGNAVRTSAVQAMSVLPDPKRADNTMTIIVGRSPHGTVLTSPVPEGPPPPAQEQATPPASVPPPPVTITPLSPSAAIGILKPTPFQIKPQPPAPAPPPPAQVAPDAEQSPPPYTGKYRVVINGLRVNHETVDDMWQHDGKRDEVYVAAFVRLQSGPYTDSFTGRRKFELHDYGFVKSMVHGDVNMANRIQAGSASDLGGIRTGDTVPGPQDPALPAARPPSTTTFPFTVWEGTLDGGKILRIHPTLWEWDGELGNYNHWTWTMTDTYINHADGGDFASTYQVWSQGNAMLIDNVAGHDHPIGVSYYYIQNKSKLRVYEPIITLTQRKLEELFSSPSSIGGAPPVVIPINFVDSGEGLEGNYTMYLRVEKVP